MALGAIKWFHALLGCGVIAPDDGTASVVVRLSSEDAQGLARLKKGDRLEYDTMRAMGGGALAINMRIVEEAGGPLGRKGG